MLSVTLTFKPMTLKMSSVSHGPGNELLCQFLLKYADAFQRQVKKMPPKVLTWPFVVSLWPRFLTMESRSYNFDLKI